MKVIPRWAALTSEYAAASDKKPKVADIVVLSREGGWKIAGYSIH